jgi:hypothetical protein
VKQCTRQVADGKHRKKPLRRVVWLISLPGALDLAGVFRAGSIPQVRPPNTVVPLAVPGW